MRRYACPLTALIIQVLTDRRYVKIGGKEAASQGTYVRRALRTEFNSRDNLSEMLEKTLVW